MLNIEDRISHIPDVLNSAISRCWIGTEVEHNDNYGSTTLFIESTIIDFSVVETIISLLPHIHSVYLGAGEKDIIEFKNSAKLKDLDINIILETDISNVNKIPIEVAKGVDNLILRYNCGYDLQHVSNSVHLKCRSSDAVSLSETTYNGTTDISEVSNMMYKNDIILYIKGDKNEDFSYSN